jgi:membrane protein YdbS with pleckstrin-like domain
MRAIKAAMLLTAIGTAVCLWLLMGVTWYNFLAFMLLAQPLLLLGAVIYVGIVLRDLRRKGVL